MKLINDDTGNTIVGTLTPADVRTLHDAGVESRLTPDDGAGGGGGAGGEPIPTDVEPDDPDAGEAGGPADDDADDDAPDADPSGAGDDTEPGDDEPDDDGQGSAGDDQADDQADDDGDADAQDGDAPDAPDAPGDDASGDGDADDADASDTDLDVDPDMLDALDALDDDRDPSDWFNTDDDYAGADDSSQRRYDRLQREIDENNTDMAERIDQRDDRQQSRVRGHEFIRDALRDTGLASEVEEAFKQIKTHDEPRAATGGDSIQLDNYVRHRAGDYQEDRFYEEREPIDDGDRCVGVALDMSNSMDEKEAKVALGALHVATNAIGDDLTASAYTTERERGKQNQPVVELITGPNEPFDWEHLDATTTQWRTPTASGVFDVRRLLDESARREKVMIVVTDGQANVSMHGKPSTDDAVADAAEQVALSRQEGMKVIGLGVGDEVERDMLAEIFGRDGFVMAGMSDLADRLVEIYRGQMHVDDTAR